MKPVLECRDARPDLPEPDLRQQVCEEYLDLPGLRLTLAQACRLWGRNETDSQQVLDALVDALFLRREGSCYVRADADSVEM
jgi:hypothetical protein